MKTNLARMLCLVAGSLAQAQKSSAHGNESLLMALENAWNLAQLHHDSRALDDLVSDTFINDNDGNFQTKAEFLSDNRDPAYAPTVMANSDVKIFLYDNAAVVAGTYHAKGAYKGKSFDHYGRFTDTWVFTSGKWLCVASHTSPLKKARSSQGQRASRNCILNLCELASSKPEALGC